MTRGISASSAPGSVDHVRGARGVDDQEFERAQRHLRMALEVNRMCTWEYDAVRDRFDYSAERTPVEGTSLEALDGSLADVLERVHHEDRARVDTAIHNAIVHGLELHVEARILVGPARHTRWLLARGAAERDETARVVRITGVARDLTRRKEGEVLRHVQAQGERLRALGEMASGIAHDLNQSLALITGYSDMARQELGSAAPDLQRVREMVEITGQAAIEGGHALSGLLTFVRSQELMAESERVDVADLLNDVARLTAPRWRDAPQAEGRPITLRVDVEPDCAIDGTPGSLREAITNLVFNAVDALPRGGSITLAARCAGGRALIEVSDTGTGVPRDIQSRIFDPFFTTKGEHGTGLGLSQVLGILERHDGTIELDSEPGRGTTFRLSFPESRVTAARGNKLPGDRPTSLPRRSISVLVVEDEAQLGRMASLVLSQRGHRASIASSGEDALAHLEQERFDLVISDLGLGPGKNGWDLADAVRQRWPETRFVLVTGWGAGINPEEARARGVDRVLPKPYRIADLRQIADDVAALSSKG